MTSGPFTGTGDPDNSVRHLGRSPGLERPLLSMEAVSETRTHVPARKGIAGLLLQRRQRRTSAK